jgi:two-component system, chemotaxis family, protein-glutamate methylesterase/glutaminase
MNDRPSVVVIGGSAGAIDALLRLVPKIPVAMPARLFVAVHVPATATSALPAILARAGRLPARHPRDGDETEPGVLYVAPPDHHLLVKRTTVRVVRGPRENGHRPAIDPLFRSAAASHGSRVIAVVLSGNLDDGAAGARAVAAAGGRVIVQHPDDSPYPSMPLSALATTPSATAVPLADIAGALVELLHTPHPEVAEMSADRFHGEPPPDPVELDAEASEAFTRRGKPAGIACPECNGGIFELDVEGVPHFRCRVGHAYSAESLYLEQRASLETALWTALRALEESAELARRLVTRSSQRGNQRAADSFQHNADVYMERAEVIRGVLRHGLPVVGESEQPAAAH